MIRNKFARLLIMLAALLFCYDSSTLIKCINQTRIYTIEVINPIITRKVFIDSAFTEYEHRIIEDAIDEWHRATNYLVKFEIVDACLSAGVKGAVIFKKVNGNNAVVQDITNEMLRTGEINEKYRLIGYYDKFDINPTIYLVDDRINNEADYKAIAMHEIGHSLGINLHTNDLNSIMFPFINDNAGCLTKADLSLFCSIYRCNVEDLIYCSD